jgi:hypothetical protein
VFATVTLSDPVSVAKVTGTFGRTLPLPSNTFAVIVAVPPADDTVVGFALVVTLATAAAPTAILTALAAATEAPPDEAVIVAVPLALPALNWTTARPLTSVSTSEGTIVPSVVVKMMCVPEWGGVPADSNTCAMSSVVPFTGRAVVDAVSVIVEPVGAKSGTFSQPAVTSGSQIALIAANLSRRVRAIFKILSILAP